MKITAVANANIALIKYWGKRDEKLILPQNSNISVTLDGLNATTTVEFDKKYVKDIFILNDKEQQGDEANRVFETIEIIRKIAKIKEKVKVSSKNNFPTAAGLASSAAGGAALALAASTAAGLKLNNKELSIIARRNSGSAARSIDGGFIEWLKGNELDGSDSYGNQIAPEQHWPEFRIIATILTTAEKKIKSRPGMTKSVQTCPYYKCWLNSIDDDLNKVREGILKKDFSTVGKISEENAIKMHALMWTTKPAIMYWMPESLEVINIVHEMRDSGIECYYTMDAGPQVKIICLEKDLKKIQSVLNENKSIKDMHICKPGESAKIINKHLF